METDCCWTAFGISRFTHISSEGNEWLMCQKKKTLDLNPFQLRWNLLQLGFI